MSSHWPKKRRERKQYPGQEMIPFTPFQNCTYAIIKYLFKCNIYLYIYIKEIKTANNFCYLNSQNFVKNNPNVFFISFCKAE